MGIDLHARTFTIAVKDRDGNELFVETHKTSCEKLRKIVGSVNREKWVVLEESALASWAYRVLQGCGAKVVVADSGGLATPLATASMVGLLECCILAAQVWKGIGADLPIRR